MENLKKIIIFNLILIFCLTAFLKVKAAETAQTALSLGITGGALSVTAPSSATFAGKSFSYDNQESLGNSIGNIIAEDARSAGAAWNVNISATDWKDGTKTMLYNGNGTTEGRLSLDIPELSGVTSTAGADTSGITVGTDAAFTGSTAIKLVGGSAASVGRYNISGLKASQFIPGGQAAGSYTTNLTLTIS